MIYTKSYIRALSINVFLIHSNIISDNNRRLQFLITSKHKYFGLIFNGESSVFNEIHSVITNW